jgi:hypothetical protein
MMRPVVVIPVYKSVPDADEIQSLAQCLSILAAHPIVFVKPYGLDISPYAAVCAQFNQPVEEISFDDFYFQSIAGYNRLLLSKIFYSRFGDYDYMLIYQLDAWVFKDELMEWCAKAFSYIGAPWFVGEDRSNANSDFMEYAGNGGFSLRRVPDFLKVLSMREITKSPTMVLEEYRHFSWPLWFIRVPVMILRMLGLRNNSNYERSRFALNEDHYWAYFATKVNPAFKAARAKQAIAFAFECQPARMFELNNSRLPFGCHAWMKYDFNFWKPFIAK